MFIKILTEIGEVGVVDTDAIICIYFKCLQLLAKFFLQMDDAILNANLDEEGSTPCPNDIFGPGKCHLPAFDCP